MSGMMGSGSGGMMGGGMMGGGMMGGMGRMMQGMQHGRIWTVNGVAATGHVMDPMLTLQHGRSCVLELANDTAWPNPIHLPGHSFRVLSRHGAPTRPRARQHTVLLPPPELEEIASDAHPPTH